MSINYLGMEQIGIMFHITSWLIRNGRAINIDDSVCQRQNGVHSSTMNLSGSEKDLNDLYEEMRTYEGPDDFSGGTEEFTEGRPPVAIATYELKVIAPNEPGVINTVSGLTTDNGINIANQVSNTIRLMPTDIEEIDLIEGPREKEQGGKFSIIHWWIEIPSEDIRERFEQQLGKIGESKGWRISIRKRCDGPPEPSILRQGIGRN